MKRVLLFLSLLVLFVPVYAIDNRLYLTENNNRIYYESDQIDKKVFMNHIDMIPGSNYEDILTIENAANREYKLFFKVSVKEQSNLASDFLDYINMQIYLDNKLIYNGKAKGLDYNNVGVNLQDAVLLGNFTKNQKSEMKVITNLSKEYSNTNNHDTSLVDWTFYAQYDDSSDPIVIPDVPKTDKNTSRVWYYVSVLALVTGIVIIFLANRKKNK